MPPSFAKGGHDMTYELQMLIWAAALALVQMVAAAMGAQGQVGLPLLAGNREDMPALTGWAGRAKRAHHNMLESLVVFAIVVIVAHLAGRSNPMTALGAALFFWARLAYALVYLIGIPWLRTAVWAVSMAGIVLIFVQLF
jgi:uncharacterized MAPEG superfamily protein